MKPGEVYRWKANWHETFQHLLVGSSNTVTSFIQTIWIDKNTISSDHLLPAVPPASNNPNSSGHGGAGGIRAEKFMYQTDYMIFTRAIDVEKNGFDAHGYGEPIPDALDDDEEFEDVDAAEEVIHSTYQLQNFVTYFWFEFLLFSPDGQNCNLCTWIFLEQNDNGIPSKPERVFYKYFEDAFASE